MVLNDNKNSEGVLVIFWVRTICCESFHVIVKAINTSQALLKKNVLERLAHISGDVFHFF